MVAARAAVILVALSTAIGFVHANQTADSEMSNPEQVLQSSTDSAALQRAAILLAASKKPAAITLLGQSLRDPDFLTRLDGKNGSATGHSTRVLQALADNPGPQVIELFNSLAEDPAFVAVDQRKIAVMELLARTRPMTQQTAAVFERSSDEDYFAFSAQLLAQNASPRALELFQSMMLDRSASTASRLECLHKGIVPRRMQLPVLQTAARILTRTRERAIARGAAESLFGYRQDWFGIESGITEPPPWPKASSDVLHAACSAADAALARPDIDGQLREKILAIRKDMTNTLAAREK